MLLRPPNTKHEPSRARSPAEQGPHVSVVQCELEQHTGLPVRAAEDPSSRLEREPGRLLERGQVGPDVQRRVAIRVNQSQPGWLTTEPPPQANPTTKMTSGSHQSCSLQGGPPWTPRLVRPPQNLPGLAIHTPTKRFTDPGSRSS